MIQRLTELGPYMAFINEINSDPVFSDPMLSTQEQMETNLLGTVNKPDYLVLGAFDDGAMTGLFVFLVLEDERYMEMLVGLSRVPVAYEEAADYLQAHYPGYQADFVFNPANTLLRQELIRRGALIYEEQQRMVLSDRRPGVDTAGIEPLSERWKEQYIAIHDTDCYWTGDKVAEAHDRFSVFLAVEDGAVIGYIDVTNDSEENEIYNIEVREADRRRGWGRKLVARAIEMNRSPGVMLFVDVSNVSAIRLYESVGFVKEEGKNSQTVTWNINP